MNYKAKEFSGHVRIGDGWFIGVIDRETSLYRENWFIKELPFYTPNWFIRMQRNRALKWVKSQLEIYNMTDIINDD